MTNHVKAETVSPGHPDKFADLISDYVLTMDLQNINSSRVAVFKFPLLDEVPPVPTSAVSPSILIT